MAMRTITKDLRVAPSDAHINACALESLIDICERLQGLFKYVDPNVALNEHDFKLSKVLIIHSCTQVLKFRSQPILIDVSPVIGCVATLPATAAQQASLSVSIYHAPDVQVPDACRRIKSGAESIVPDVASKICGEGVDCLVGEPFALV